MARLNSASQRQSQSGNVFFIILIAVGLLAAITIMISRSGSNVEQSGDVEQNRIKISQIQRYARGVEVGVQRLLLDGCSENEISFENSVDPNYVNPGSPVDKSCHIFEPEGAGLEWREFGSNDLANTTSNIGFIGSISIESLEDDGRAELIFGAVLSQGLCTQINKELDVLSNVGTEIDYWDQYFIGTYSLEEQLGSSYGLGAGLEGKSAGCFIDDDFEHVYYHVLLAR